MKYFYGYFPLSVDSRRVVVSYNRKDWQDVLTKY